MLTPKKHLSLDLSPLRIGSIILRELRKARLLKFADLQAKVVRFGGNDAVVVILPALSLLYLLGKVEYHSKNDSIEYIDKSGDANAD